MSELLDDTCVSKPVYSLALLAMEYHLGLSTKYHHLEGLLDLVCSHQSAHFSEPLILSSTIFRLSPGISTSRCESYHFLQTYKRPPSSVLAPFPIILVKTLNPVLQESALILIYSSLSDFIFCLILIKSLRILPHIYIEFILVPVG